MPLIIPNRLPAGETLKKRNIFTMRKAREPRTQDIRPLRIVIVNLMPTKIATETQLARVLANSPLAGGIDPGPHGQPRQPRIFPKVTWTRFIRPSTKSNTKSLTA